MKGFLRDFNYRVKKVFSNEESPVDYLLRKQPVISEMMMPWQIRIILENLAQVLGKNISGDVVELGCCFGTTSLFIRRMLDLFNSEKIFHVYDSFLGLPKKKSQDMAVSNSGGSWIFEEGTCQTSKSDLINNFKKAKLALPVIHTGWFKDIPDEQYPEKIAFAFFDGDFYSSISDSFEKVYKKLVKGAVVCIDDYGWEMLPGVKKACDDFLRGRPEENTITENSFIGVMVKQ